MSTRGAPPIPGVELHDVIGTGSSGIVYRGRQAAFDRPVAVKVVPSGSTDSATRARWEREVIAVGRITNHPNVVPVFDAGTTDEGTSYLVMPLVPGGTLGDRLRADGPLPAAEVASIGVKLAGALAAAHGAGVLHRDIKPDNVLWSPHGEPQLTDFGIARLQDRTATLSGGIEATVSYAAPEVLAGEEATTRSDVYGLGATLYACLTGAAPHPSVPGEHVAAAINRTLREDPAPLPDGVPPGLAHVVERAIARDPADRQPDAARLQHELERALDDTGAAPVDATRVDAPATQVMAAAGSTSPSGEPTLVGARPAPDAPAPGPRPARRDPSPGGTSGGGRTLWLVGLAVLVLVIGLVVLAGMADDRDGGDVDAADPTTVPTEAPAATDAPEETTTTAEPTTTEAPTTTTTTAPTTTEAPESAPAGEAMAETALTYLALLDDDDLDEAWAMTSPRFQAQQDRGQWRSFWEGHDIEVVGDPRVDVDSGTVVVPLTYDGQREDYELDLVRQGGAWLIDGPVGD